MGESVVADSDSNKLIVVSMPQVSFCVLREHNREIQPDGGCHDEGERQKPRGQLCHVHL